MIKEPKTIINFKSLKMNSKGKLHVKGEKNDYVVDYQLGHLSSFAIYEATLYEEAKQKYQLRSKGVYLVRLDYNGPPHMCNDGKLWMNHIHVYQEDDEFGQPVIKTYKLEDYSETEFKDLTGLHVLLDFFKICNIRLEDNVNIQEII